MILVKVFDLLQPVKFETPERAFPQIKTGKFFEHLINAAVTPAIGSETPEKICLAFSKEILYVGLSTHPEFSGL